MRTSLLTLIICLSGPVAAFSVSGPVGEAFTVVGWNVDAGGADPHLTALRVVEIDDVHLWGLCEVRDDRWAGLLERAAGEDEPGRFVRVLSPTRGSDRSLILYDGGQFSLIRRFELDWSDQPWHRPDMVLRPALVAQLRHHACGQQFFFMVNRLAPKWAAEQAVAIEAWAARQDLPVLAVGTYYFQYGVGPHPVRCEGQSGLAAMADDGVFDWIRPNNAIPTYDSDAETIEDFIFLANAAGRWSGRSRIVTKLGDFPDDDTTSDHRPVRATITISAPVAGLSLKARILRQILKIQSEVDALELLVAQLPD